MARIDDVTGVLTTVVEDVAVMVYVRIRVCLGCVLFYVAIA